MIRFLDADGFAWQVTELSTAHDAGDRGWLYFFSRGTTLRLGAYPVDWDRMAWRELDRLRGRAEVLSADVTRPRGRVVAAGAIA